MNLIENIGRVYSPMFADMNRHKSFSSVFWFINSEKLLAAVLHKGQNFLCFSISFSSLNLRKKGRPKGGQLGRNCFKYLSSYRMHRCYMLILGRSSDLHVNDPMIFDGNYFSKWINQRIDTWIDFLVHSLVIPAYKVLIYFSVGNSDKYYQMLTINQLKLFHFFFFFWKMN